MDRGVQVYAAAPEDKEALQEQCGHWNVIQQWEGVRRRQQHCHKPSPRSVLGMIIGSDNDDGDDRERDDEGRGSSGRLSFYAP